MKLAYTNDSIWRNRDTFLRGHDEIEAFLTKKWARENGYRLRKELFAFTDNKVYFSKNFVSIASYLLLRRSYDITTTPLCWFQARPLYQFTQP